MDESTVHVVQHTQHDGESLASLKHHRKSAGSVETNVSLDKSDRSSNGPAASMKKYGQIPLRNPIKKVKLELSEDRKLEDVGTYIRREIFESKLEGHVEHSTQKQKELTGFARSLHDELLETKVRSAGFDRFDNQYDPHGDIMMTASFARVHADEVRAANDTGTSLSKERFSSKYWGTWRKDVMILEKFSSEEVVAKKRVLKNHEILKIKKEKMKKSQQRNTPSMLPGTAFAGAALGHDRPENFYFDLHMQGNRNDASAIVQHSLKQPLPEYVANPASLLPADSDPDRFGNSISGGVIAMGPARGVAVKSISANIDFPPVDQPKRDPKMLSFSTGPRVSKVVASNDSGVSSTPIAATPSNLPGNKFGEEARTGGIPDSRRSYPGPGTYNMKGIFDKFAPPDYQAVIARIDKEGADFRAIHSYDLAKIGGFAYGCNRQEHVLYGFCLDGRCSKRVEFERAFLQTKNFKRLGADSMEQCLDVLPGKDKMTRPKKVADKNEDSEELKADLDILNIDGDKAMQRLKGKYHDPDYARALKQEFILSLVSDPKEYIYPLHMAASRADIQALKKMRALGLDINLQQGEREETPLHLAVRNQHLNALNTILAVFEDVVDVNVQNYAGDTPIHLASRKGFKELVAALCDANANPELKNSAGYTPLQEAQLFSIQQLLRLQEDAYKLRQELACVKQEVAAEVKKEALQRTMSLQGTDLSAYLDSMHPSSGELSAADLIQYPWRAQIVSRGGSAAPSSRASTNHSQRSRILELTAEKYDPEVDKSKTNTSLFRVARSKTKLKDSKMNSYVLGYWADDAEK